MVNKIPTLDDLANKFETDKGTKYPGGTRHGYSILYDKILSKYRSSPIRMLEVGICMEGTHGGQSVMMWREYFSDAQIYTFDIVDMSDHRCIKEQKDVYFCMGDQSNRYHLDNMYKLFGSTNFDFIIEDGSHKHRDQIISLGKLFQFVKPGGYYFLEDLSVIGEEVCCAKNDESTFFLLDFILNKNIDSPYLLKEEQEYLKDHIDNITLFPDIQNKYAVAVITKNKRDLYE